MLEDAYWCSFLLLVIMITAISTSQRMLSSYAFLSKPLLRLLNVICEVCRSIVFIYNIPYTLTRNVPSQPHTSHTQREVVHTCLFLSSLILVIEIFFLPILTITSSCTSRQHSIKVSTNRIWHSAPRYTNNPKLLSAVHNLYLTHTHHMLYARMYMFCCTNITCFTVDLSYHIIYFMYTCVL